jgi:hypothetical protein
VATRASGGQTWTDFTVDQLAAVVVDAEEGRLLREGGYWPPGGRNIRASYTHGWDAPPPAIKRAALKVLVNQLVPSNLGDRWMTVSNQAGTFRLATAGEGRNNWYGIPEVDSTLTNYRRRGPAIG